MLTKIILLKCEVESTDYQAVYNHTRITEDGNKFHLQMSEALFLFSRIHLSIGGTPTSSLTDADIFVCRLLGSASLAILIKQPWMT